MLKYPNGQEVIQNFNCKVEQFKFSNDNEEDDDEDDEDMMKADKMGFIIKVEFIEKKQGSEHNNTSAAGERSLY